MLWYPGELVKVNGGGGGGDEGGDGAEGSGEVVRW